MAATAERTVVVRAPGEGPVGWIVGMEHRTKLASEESGAFVSIVECEAPRDAGPPLHVHSREDEAFYVIDGELTIWVGADELAVAAGGLAFLPRGIPHAFAVASENARFLAFGMPGMDRFFLEAGTAAPVDGPPDIAALTETAARYGIEILGPRPERRG
jgi:quercetin dioxygenase-like cupin family protein